MRRVLRWLALVLATALAVPAEAAHRRPGRPAAPPSGPRWTGVAGHRLIRVGPIKVRDGDTFYLGPLAVRLRGIDAPELDEPAGVRAAERLATLLAAGRVRIVPRTTDVYGRVVADVYVEGRSVAAILAGEGLAVRWPARPHRRPRPRAGGRATRR